jgi:5-methylcytosine-specific restriction enzyme A
MAHTQDDNRRPPPWTWDELVLACDLVVANNWHGMTASDRRVQELSDLLQQLPVHPLGSRGAKFRNPNGVARKSVDLATNHPNYRGRRTKGGRLDLDVIRAFIDEPREMAAIANSVRYAARALGPEPEPPADLDFNTVAANEGAVILRLHLRRERDPSLRRRKIEEARKRFGCVRCEVCSFDFGQTYGDWGRDYIECHHKVPLSHSGPTKTVLNDLALLCSNCHRMVHRQQPWLSVEELSRLLNESASDDPSATHLKL